MNTFVQAVENAVNEAVARTENGMKARATTANAVLDFFSKAGSSRGTVLKREFDAALAEDVDLAIRTLLWTRDVRGGAGERKQFRDLLSSLEAQNPGLAGAIMHMVPVVGRWDDLFTYRDPLNRKAALRMYADALMDGNGLAAKWAPREKSKKASVANELRKFMQLSPKEYRKLLVRNTDVVETRMCQKDWNEIDFSTIPSLAAARYQKAFGRNAGEAYAAYLRELQKPESERDPKVKINAGAVYPYDVVKSVRSGNAAVANEQWKALPNFVGDAKIMPLVDVSGSMTWGNMPGNLTPMQVAVSLGLYLSEKNTSVFKDLFMTFESTPKFITSKGTLSQRVTQMESAPWGGSTNLHAAFKLLLDTAVKGKVKAEDMPDTILILSDMQFNHCVNHDDSAIEMIGRKYREAGYERPKVVFWNLNGDYGRDNQPVRFDEKGTALVSGFSPAVMKSVLADDLEDYTPYNVMVKTLMVDRYNWK